MIRFFVLMFAFGIFSASVAAEELTGRARAIDGQAIKVAGVSVRLFGVDAPDLAQKCTTKKGKSQNCGDLARQMLDSLTKNVKVKCTSVKKDADGTPVVSCYAGPFDINEQMVASGWANAMRGESDKYVRAENFARARSEGMWRNVVE